MFASNPSVRPDDKSRRRAGFVRRLTIETLEDRLVMSGTDLGLFAATTVDSRSVTFSFTFERGDLDPAVVDVAVVVYRSSDPTYGADDLAVAQGTLALTAPPGSVTIPLGQTLAIDPARPYVIVVGDPRRTLGEQDTGNNADAFRMFTIGAVTHGFELFPGDSQWVDKMADSLPYDVSIPFHWDLYSILPQPGMTVLAGWSLTGQVVDAASKIVASTAFEPGDVIGLHAIGHSRGSVVISQAALDLELLGSWTPALAALQAGPQKLTFLDPHPASNVYAPDLYSAAPNFLGDLGKFAYGVFCALANDPNVVVPASADWAEVDYQQNSYLDGTTLLDQLFLLWGQSLDDIEVRGTSTVLTERNLGKDVPGHYLVHDWYQSTIVPTLGGTSAAPSLAMAASSPSDDFILGVLDEPTDVFRSRLPGRSHGQAGLPV